MIELVAAAAMALPCVVPERAEIVERTRRVAVYRRGGRTLACGAGGTVTLRPHSYSRGRPRALHAAGDRVALATSDGSDLSLAVYDLGRPGLLRRDRIAQTRLVRMVLDDEGALALSLRGRTRGIHLLNRYGRFALDRRPGVQPSTLSLRDGRFRWRHGGMLQMASGRTSPPEASADCAGVPPAGVALARAPAVVYALELAHRRRTVISFHGCLPEGPPHLLARLTSHRRASLHDDARVAAARLPFVAIDLRSTVRVFDLRSGAKIVEGCVHERSATLVRTLLSPTGRLACSRREHRAGDSAVTITAYGPAQEESVLDDAADVDADSLRLVGDGIAWIRAGAFRSAGFP